MSHLRRRRIHFNFVLLGKSGSGKTATANTMLRTERRTASATLDVQKKHGRIDRWFVVVYDTPGFSSTKLTDEQVREKCQSAFSACESEADICTYLLVIRIGRFTEEERKTVETIETLLGEDRMKKTWILFTGGDELEDSTNKIEYFINELDAMKKLVQKYENRYHVFNNKMRSSPEQVQCLLNKVETARKNLNLLEENCRWNTSTHPRGNREKEMQQTGKGFSPDLDYLEKYVHLTLIIVDATSNPVGLLTRMDEQKEGFQKKIVKKEDEDFPYGESRIQKAVIMKKMKVPIAQQLCSGTSSSLTHDVHPLQLQSRCFPHQLQPHHTRATTAELNSNPKSIPQSHQSINTRDKPYTCLLCGRSFTLLSALKVHLDNHS